MNEQVKTEGRRAINLVVGVVLVLVFAGVLARIGYQQVAERQQVLEKLDELDSVTNSIGMQLVKVPGGSFVMGDDAPGRGPAHKVRR